VTGETFQIFDIDRGNQGTAGEISNRNDERIDGQVRTTPRGPKQLSGAHPHPRVYGMHLHALTSEAREDLGIGRATADHFGENRRHSPNRQAPGPHLRDERTDAISPLCRPLRNGRERLTVEE
jgi:hypothetical protein